MLSFEPCTPTKRISLQQACMHPYAQTTEWNILLSKWHIYLNTWYTKLNTSKQGVTKSTALQKLYYTMQVMTSELDHCVASLYASFSI